jgi:hypothetical protein
MDNATQQKACDAFNVLRMDGKIHPDGHYFLIHDGTRRNFFQALEPYLEAPANYVPSKDYVFLWRNGPPSRPFLDATLIEVREFIAAAVGRELRPRLIHSPTLDA